MLRVDDVRVAFDGVAALDSASLEAEAGRTLAVLGTSGCGKTTLLRAIAGLQTVDSGRILLDGDNLTGVPVHRRGIGLMFQDNALFPHRDVAGNIAFGLRVDRRPRHEIARRVQELLALVGLPGSATRAVQTLSGGEQQRVALARALAREPRILLLDEPLGSLDERLRERLLDDLRDLFARLQLTVVYVTHDVGEAFALGHAVAIMREGKVVQRTTPDDLWRRPADDWVARFLGMRNIRDDGDRCLVIPAEAVVVEPGDDAVVRTVERRGAVVWLSLALDDGRELDSVTTDSGHPRAGERVGVRIDETSTISVLKWKG
ncbi:MAG: ABC transporter ATP-binding protein [Gaiellaceae bacterium]